MFNLTRLDSVNNILLVNGICQPEQPKDTITNYLLRTPLLGYEGSLIRRFNVGSRQSQQEVPTHL